MFINYEPFIVYDIRDGREICQCGAFEDALAMIAFDPDHRAWKKRKLILDHVIDVAAEELPRDKELKEQRVLPEREAVPFSPFKNE